MDYGWVDGTKARQRGEAQQQKRKGRFRRDLNTLHHYITALTFPYCGWAQQRPRAAA